MASSPQRLAIAALLGAVVTLGASPVASATAGDGADPTTPAPAALAAVRVDEHLGAQVPLGLRFRDQDGKSITLGDLVRGDLPVILTFNYSSCPMLCALQLNALVGALPDAKLAAGRQFRIVTIILEPTEELARAAETRTSYLDKLGASDTKLRAAAANGGWTFAIAETPGDDRAIRALASTVGVAYQYLPDKAEWAHPAVLTFLSPSGIITRYMHGITYSADELRLSVMRAGIAEPSASVGFLQRCYHWDPTANSKAKFGRQLMMVFAGVFAAVVFIALGLAHYLRRSGAVPRAHHEGVPRP